ncbi:sugar phosphate isomerase/epimerase family protein [Sinomicrobium soli]|uniref:sugar phosphate isomerase/epimerase family protein n=1 Tax=Sinomicrobium sp. N-1-3-6 TaxID=2219864 RepID=UPI000DCC540A|nr:sugar phosphate isomerase/epimerase [Sinomicrobium sp. N-1-3-6]RAV28106.1 sugar phosphate isomerase/epimerase [Sinomicrobium sp. N-1-3-6]
MNRRNFIKQSGLAATAAVMPVLPFDWKNKDTSIGLQLYSISPSLSDDFEGNIAKVAELGYTHVESAGYNKKERTLYNRSAREYRKIIRANGLQPISAHVRFSPEEAAPLLDDFATIGVKYVVWPSVHGGFRKSADGYRRAAAQMNTVAAQARERGIRFGYHNHNFEFQAIDGKIPYDILLENTDPELVFFQMDLGWLVKGGFQPQDYFRKHQGRFPLWHIRDVNDDGKSVPVGSGKLDFHSIWSQRELAGYELGMVETQQRKTSPLNDIKQSIHYLKTEIIK